MKLTSECKVCNKRAKRRAKDMGYADYCIKHAQMEAKKDNK